MRILGLKKYGHGYIGILENQRCYAAFQYVRGTPKIVQTYPREDFKDYRHFVSFMGRFMRNSFFLVRPVEVDKLSERTLGRVARIRG